MRVPFTVFALCLLSMGCPQTVPVGDEDASTPDPAGDAGTDMNSTDDVGTTDGEDASQRTDVLLEFVGVEWGLFPADVALPSASTTTLQQSANRWTGEADIPAGVVGARFTVAGEVVLDSAAQHVDQAYLLEDIEAGPAFNAVAGRFSVEVVSTGEAYDVTLTRLDEPSWALDSPEAPSTIGAWWDEGARGFREGEDPGAVTAGLMDQLRRNGGPVHTQHGVLFVAAAQDGEPAPQIRGSWTNWEADPETELRRIRRGLWARYIAAPEGEQLYKLVYGDGATWVTDRSNPHIEWDGIDPGTVGDFNSILRPEPGSSRLIWWPGVDSTELGNQRDVYVQLPAGYDGGAGAYPTLYFHDGNESIVRGEFHDVAAATASANPATATVNVYVALPSQDVRITEYTMGNVDSRGDAYVNFLAATLVPMIDGAFRTRDERQARGLAGASLGGLISFWGALQFPDVFGYAAGMSSSFFWEENFMIQQIAERGCQDLDYYLDSGSPNDNYEVTLTMRDELDNLGCRYTYELDEGGAHEWSYWNARVSGVFEDFAAVHGDGT